MFVLDRQRFLLGLRGLRCCTPDKGDERPWGRGGGGGGIEDSDGAFGAARHADRVRRQDSFCVCVGGGGVLNVMLKQFAHSGRFFCCHFFMCVLAAILFVWLHWMIYFISYSSVPKKEGKRGEERRGGGGALPLCVWRF